MANGMQFNQNSLALAPSGQSRREQMAQALMANATSGRPVQGGLVEALSRVGQAYFANQTLNKADQQREQRRQALADTLQRAVQSAQPGATTQNPMVGPSQMSDAQRMAAILAQNPDTAGMGAQIQLSQALQKPGERFSQPFQLPDGTLVQRNQATGRLEEVGGAGQTINVGGGEPSPFEKQFGKAQADALIKQQQAAQGAVQSLQAAKEADKLLNDGMVTGFGGDWIVGFGKALQKAGFDVGGEAIDNSQAFGALMAQQVAQIIKQFGAGTGLSDKDREFAQKAAAGDINMTENAIRRIISLNRKASENTINRFNERVKRIPRGVVPFDLTVPLPEEGSMPNAPNTGASSGNDASNTIDFTDLQ